MNVGKAIFNILSNDAGLSELVGNRIFPEMAPEQALNPYLVYSVLSIDPTDTKQASSTVDVSQLETYSVSNNYSDCMDVSEAARAALDRNAGLFSEVNIQSIQYQSADTEFNATQRVYIAQQRYSVRELRAGQATDVSLVSPENILVQDGAAVTGRVDTLNFTPGVLSVADNAATIAASYLGVNTELLTQTINAAYLKSGASELDLNTYTEQAPLFIPFGDEVDSLGTVISENGTSGYFNLSEAGTYLVSVGVTFYSTGNGVAPHFYARTYNATQGQVNEVPEGTAYINGQHGVTHSTGRLELYLTVLANTRIYIYGYDESDRDSAINILTGRITLRRIA